MAIKRKSRYGEKDYQREKLKVLKLLEEVTLFDDSDDARRLAECEADFWQFAHAYLPHYFSAPKQAEWHGELVDTLNTVRNRVATVAAPRGYSKSTIVSFAYILWRVLFKKTRFTVLEMETEPKAVMQTWRILLELQFNPRILHDFGKIVADECSRGDFSTIVTESRPYPTRVLAFGAGMSARGLVNAQFRPDLFICDDLESRALARNPKRVEALEDIVLADNLGAMCAGEWTFLIIGTVICRGSFLDRSLKNEAFVRLKFRAIENMGMPDERSTWPELHPLENLHVTLESMGRVRFMSEKQNDPIETGGTFNEKWFRYIKELPAELDYTRLIDQIDPSYSQAGDNKACYIMANYEHGPARRDFGAWRDTRGNVIEEGLYLLVMRPYNRKSSIDEFIAELFIRYHRWRPMQIMIDGSFAQKHMYRREVQRVERVKGVTLPIKFTDQQRNKTEKVMELQPDIERGVILFLDDGSPDLEQTVIQFARFGEPGVNDDGPDAIAEGKETLRKLSKKARVTFV